MPTTLTPADRLARPLNRFFRNEPLRGVVLFVTVLVAMLWANSPWRESYHQLWQYPLSFSLGDFTLSKSLHDWINDGLMALFFFLIGLEIKEEVRGGELASLRKASLPVAAALGGMLVPALIYTLFNYNTEAAAGWGVPMATDIAFSLGLLSLLGSRVPTSLKVFLTALATVDDLGAVLVIAFFYTSDIVAIDLLYGALFLGILVLGNFLGIRRTWFYALLGIGGVWLAFLLSGVHATIAGVLLAFTIPDRTKINEDAFVDRTRQLINTFEQTCTQPGQFLTTEQMQLINRLRQTARDSETPLQKLAYRLTPFVYFFVLPLFALSNGGITLEENLLGTLLSPVSLGVMTGLLVGKLVGILVFSRLLVRLGWGELPQQTTWRLIGGVGLLAGIGFTISLFITELAFTDEVMIIQAKTGIFAASLLSGTLGMVWLRWVTRPEAA